MWGFKFYTISISTTESSLQTINFFLKKTYESKRNKINSLSRLNYIQSNQKQKKKQKIELKKKHLVYYVN